MKQIILLVLLILFGCSGGGGGGTGSSTPKLETKVEAEFLKIKDISQREFSNVLNSITQIKGEGSFRANSIIEFKQGQVNCVGASDLKIIYDRELKVSSISRSTRKNSGNCNGAGLTKNFQTKKDLNLSFLYKTANFKGSVISEGTYSGKRAFLVSYKGNDQNTVYLLSVNGDSFDSLLSEYSYLNNDGYINLKTVITPTEGTKIDQNLLEDTPETGDILELSEFPLYDLIG